MSDAVIKKRPQNSKTCPLVHYMNNFDMEKFNGTWYEIYTSMSNSTFTERCDRMKLSIAPKGRLSIYRRFINAQGSEVKSMGIAAEIEEGLVAFHYPAFTCKIESFLIFSHLLILFYISSHKAL